MSVGSPSIEAKNDSARRVPALVRRPSGEGDPTRQALLPAHADSATAARCRQYPVRTALSGTRFAANFTSEPWLKQSRCHYVCQDREVYLILAG